MRVRFVEVGRNRMTWEVNLKDWGVLSLVREIKRKRALLSRGVDVVGGVIYSGDRPVGRVEFVMDALNSIATPGEDRW